MEERIEVGERRIRFATNELFGGIDGTFHIAGAWMKSRVEKLLLNREKYRGRKDKHFQHFLVCLD